MSTLRQSLRAMSRNVQEEPDAVLRCALAELTDSWQKGERRSSEYFLQQHPELASNPESAVRLIYEEICLRQEEGEHIDSAAVLQRFPQWRSQLEILLGCHNWLLQEEAGTDYPQANEQLGEFQLLAELGRGAEGRVFLARELSLGGRPVVLKLTRRDGREHLSLARLQNTNIVPLYSVSEHPDRNLRVLCMPCLGGTTLAHVLEDLRGRKLEDRHGRDILEALDGRAANLPVAFEIKGPARAVLARSSYVEAICWIGACLAEGLQYAHERDLIHFDVKPSNILLASDAQPLLLDFHLAHPPLRQGDPPPQQLGGTRDYLSPEQWQALQAVRTARPIVATVDGRSDIYSLGLVLYEALCGIMPAHRDSPLPELHRCNRHVSIGLSDVIQRMTARDSDQRYPTAAAAAADLRRHLHHEPLAGVANRSLRERWQKWRWRRPHALGITIFAAILLIGMALVSSTILWQGGERRRLAVLANTEAQEHMSNRRYTEAVHTLNRGIRLCDGWFADATLRRSMEASRVRAERARKAHELHTLAEHLRFTFAAEPVPSRRIGVLDLVCRDTWKRRAELLDRGGGRLELEMERGIRDDLLDVALFWCEIQMRQAPAEQRAAAKARALHLLDEAEDACGPGPILVYERQALSRSAPATGDPLPDARTAWEHFVLGRALYRDGKLEAAGRQFQLARELQPDGFWPTVYQGLTEYRTGQPNAVYTFSTAIGQAPTSVECYYLRARAFAAIGQLDAAGHDLDHALKKEEGFVPARVQRGWLNRKRNRPDAALDDFRKAFELGGDPAQLYVQCALTYLEQRRYQEALAALGRALQLVDGSGFPPKL
jgi:serine/threonine protein kinase